MNMAETDIRWKQRLENFNKALERLNEAAQIMEKELEDRNLSSHDYDRLTAESIFLKVVGTYLPLFNQFKQTMSNISDEEV